jgi:ribosomal protein S18 acetylase RimI-like enzyme
MWMPETNEYALVAPWRHRDELPHIQELSAIRHPEAIVDAVVSTAGSLGANAILCIELDESRRPEFYRRVDFDLLEEVVTYELFGRPTEPAVVSAIEFRGANPSTARERAELMRIDHAAFPWGWQNSDEEFIQYGFAPGVEIYLTYLDNEPVGYVGITAYLGWGHIDRVAIAPEWQGRGLGRESVRFSIDRLFALGAKRIGLSTQLTNERSQRLYEGLGFRRAIANDYRLYGRVLRHPEGVANLT